MLRTCVYICLIFIVFVACTPVYQVQQPVVGPSPEESLTNVFTQSPAPARVSSPAATGTITSKPACTDTSRPHPTVSPTPTTGSPLYNIDPRGLTIIFWHSWGKSAAGGVLSQIVDRFNTANEWGIQVAAIGKDSYGDLESDLYEALSHGDEPDLIIAYPNVLTKLWHQGIIADIDLYLDDPQYGLPAAAQADFYPAALMAGSFDRARVGFPFSQSANVIFYNRTWALELGFQNPPLTADEFIAQACAASLANDSDADPTNDGTGGFVLYPGSANILSWIYAFEGEIFDPDTERYAFNSRPVQDVALFLKEVNDRGCAFQTNGYPNPEFAMRKALFTTSSTVGCQYQQKEFDRRGSSREEWQLLAFPGNAGAQAIVIFPQMLGLMDHSPESKLATWLFIKYLTSPEIQAEWAEGSQYYPVRISAIKHLTDFAVLHHQWASGFDLINIGRSEPTHPSWGLVRQYTQAAFTNLLEDKAGNSRRFLTELDLAAVEAVAETNK